ncbi:hypothetical protein Daesc_002035 [Daldinia eschscholtzii]|uniref:Uncharacterized protein n=1 Tax=Daldinia eschscholtzii TaxID=292717 RepID=A0AAX6MVX0_9PEZI
MAEGCPHFLKAFYINSYQMNFYLGQHAHDLRFAVSIRPTGSDKLVMLHNGPTEDDQVLAVGEKVGWFPQGHQMVNDIILPPLIGGWPDIITSIMDPKQKFTNHWYQFSMKVGEGETSHDEKFEWRPTQGNEIRAMFKHAKGFKLIRMEAEGPGKGRGGNRRSREIGETSDGKEVVAVWATKKTLLPMPRSPLKFELLGSGKTGELGRQFGYMALITALEIWCFQVLKVHDNGLPYIPHQ